MATLLVVDQEANTRLLFREEFQEEGYRVAVAETTGEALRKIQRSKPDIITLDIKIPGTAEIEFLKKIKEEERDIPVILCSAYAGYKRDFRIELCDAFVVQSADLTELKAIVKRILDRGQTGFFRQSKRPAESFSSPGTIQSGPLIGHRQHDFTTHTAQMPSDNSSK